MRFIRGLILGLLVASSIHLWLLGWDNWKESLVHKIESITLTYRYQDQERDHALPHHVYSEELIYIGMSVSELEQRLGQPNRKEPSSYGYTWWVYNQDWESYIQLGVEQDQVVTFYTNAPGWEWSHLSPGMSQSEWEPYWDQKQELSFAYQSGSYTFTLSEQDIQERPLLIKDQTAIQLYVDIHNQHQISGIRVMDLRTLLLHRPYALKYIGSLPEIAPLSQQDWEEVEKAYERQIFDVTNVIRKRYQLPPFEWHEEVAEVAKGHSRDMQENDFFDHFSPLFGELGDRLENGQIMYRSAGENIAWNYIDGPDAHEGWMNSPGHRKNVLKSEFTHLGVGVIQKYYTQNFLRLY